jgi:glucose 1-dehydrogenase
VRLAQDGADIAIDYRSHPEDTEETKSKVEAAGRQDHVIKADLAL